MKSILFPSRVLMFVPMGQPTELYSPFPNDGKGCTFFKL